MHSCLTVATKQANSALAVRELNRKLQLEQAFTRQVRSIFRRMRDDFRVTVAASGVPPRADRYTPDWTAAISAHFERVQRGFQNEVQEQNGTKFIDWILRKQVGQDTDELIRLALLRWRESNAPDKARFIAETNDAEMREVIRIATRQLAEEGEATTNRAIAAVAAAILTARFAARVGTIALTNTQEAAEATKQITAEAVAGRVPFPVRDEVLTPTVIEPPTESTKTWDTVGDRRVRPSHQAADGQTIPLDASFTVGDSRLRFPGDVALGAPIGEWINCRCSARYEIA